MILITVKSHFCRKNVIILPLFTQLCYGRNNSSRKSLNHLVVSLFYCMALNHSQMQRHMIRNNELFVVNNLNKTYFYAPKGTLGGI